MGALYRASGLFQCLRLKTMLPGHSTAKCRFGIVATCHQMGRNRTEILEAAGPKLNDIVSGHVYLRDIQLTAP